MTSKRIALAVAGAALLLACGANQFQAKTTYDSSIDFASYKTFAQAPPPSSVPNMPGYSTITGNNVNQRIAYDLEQKGLQPTSWDEADLQVRFSLGSQLHEQPQYWGAWGWGWYGAAPMTTDYVAGSLVIDIADREKKLLIWHGYGTQDIFSSEQLNQQTIFNAVDALLAKYPPRREVPAATEAGGLRPFAQAAGERLSRITP